MPLPRFSDHVRVQDWGRYNLTGTVSASAVATWTDVIFNNSDGPYPSAYFNPTNGRWTPPPGPVYISAVLYWAAAQTTGTFMGIAKNGAILWTSESVDAAGNQNTTNPPVDVFDIANGTDYYTVQYYKPDATARTIFSTSWFNFISFRPDRVSTHRSHRQPEHLQMDGFVSEMAADFTLTLGSDNRYKIPFSRKIYDPYNRYDNVNYRWTPKAGVVLIHYNLWCNNADINGVWQYTYKNGAVQAWGYTSIRPASTSSMSLHAIALDYANGTDYYEPWASGWNANRLLKGDNNWYNIFSGMSWPWERNA